MNQFLQHLQSHCFLEPFQSAYRKCHSTETALLRVVNDLLQASDSGRAFILSLVDLLAAFDTIDHNLLITRLVYLQIKLPYSVCFLVMNQPHLF